MLYLILSILSSSLLVLAFKVFERTRTPIFQAIVFNYLSATLCAYLFLPNKSSFATGEIWTNSWLSFSLLLGSLFITVFNLISIATVRYGVSTASVAMKLGLVFPVLLAFTIYGEEFNWMKLVGILLAFVAVVLSSIRDAPMHQTHKSSFAVLPFFIFAGSGLCDSLTQLANKKYVAQTGMEEFSFFLFAAAATLGTLIFAFQLSRKKTSFHWKSLVGGVVLGIVNYFSFLFMLKALATVSWGSSVVFPLSNLGTVACASLAGILIFREKISLTNAVGLIFAVLAIALIVGAHYL
ncbi:MAG: EamA family transporter [Bacteroidetes bacterium]|nr:EamA family transporter [Bacteroidota bacterium]